MEDILTQAQIDELINSMLGGSKEPLSDSDRGLDKKVRVYDFKIPKKFNKEQLKTLSIIYENYGRLLSAYLSGTLRTYCQVEVLDIEEQRYFEYSNALPERNMVGVFEMPPLQGSSMITISQSLAFAIIDRLLGGQGDSYETDRDYTEIEAVLMERVVRECIAPLEDAWANVQEITPRLIRLEGSSRQSQLVSPNQIVVIVALNVQIRNAEGIIGFCIPYEILEPVLEHLNTRYWFTERKASEEDRKVYQDILRQRMAAIPMELKAVIGTSHITLKEIMDLRVGDVIQLDQRITDKAIIKSNDFEWFAGTLGLYRNHVAVRIDERLR